MCNRLTIVLVASLVVGAGCKPSNPATATSTTSTTTTTAASPVTETGAMAATGPLAATAGFTPEQLGEIGAAIKKQPDQAQQILATHGLDQASFEKAIRGVTQDPDLSKRYANAFRKSAS